jgi:hypothetical protein
MKMNKSKFMMISGMIILTALTRLMPHPWNVTPVAAMALFSGAKFPGRWFAFIIPFATLLLSDAIIGFYSTLPFVYGSFFLIVLLGQQLKNRESGKNIILFSLSSSLLFFIVTNFGHWLVTALYPKTMLGLLQCYAAGLPFYRNTLAGDLFYVALLFGSLSWAERRIPILQQKTTLTV